MHVSDSTIALELRLFALHRLLERGSISRLEYEEDVQESLQAPPQTGLGRIIPSTGDLWESLAQAVTSPPAPEEPHA